MRLLEKEEGFVGVGEGASAKGTAILIVHVVSPDAAVCAKIPAEIEGVSISAQFVGRPRKF